MSVPVPERETTLELGIADYLTGIAVGEKSSLGIVRVENILQEQVATHGAVFAVRQIPGASERRRWQLIASLGIDVFAATYTDAWAAVRAAETLLAKQRFHAGGYAIDSSTNPSAFARAPHPNLTALSSVWRVTTRSL